MIGLTTVFAVMNRGRGSHFWSQIDSTVASRLTSILGMSLCVILASGETDIRGDVLLAWTWATLSLWEFFGWDNYWSAAIGNAFNPDAATFAPVDWLLKQMPWFSSVYQATAGNSRRRTWGTTAMGLRQAMAAPGIIGVAFLTGYPGHSAWAAATLLLGIPYYVGGRISTAYAVPIAEYTVGGILGLLFYLATH
ncbi:hypothetical protein [Fimbriiglobus ruber]|uniref:Uncharacterized protein n=1 Tax=Fimbriiglobus ruber TaxID=1908690 RepID=A0A225DY84_9BACT|nr:hypothetical protein [Fimbriiglobus ruber]OWK42209.1 hypothetical protein FRUB_04287 [Fimbriiglobus ruber]